MKGTAITISLELRLSEGSLHGQVADSSGSTTDFLGWVGLIAAIDALLPDDQAPGHPTKLKEDR